MIAAGAAAAAAGVAVYAAMERNCPLFGTVLRKIEGNRLALTFDDGPNPEATASILDTLAETGTKATFFVLGKHARMWPALVRRAAEEGHTIGNHGYFHRKLHLRGREYTRQDLALGTAAIEEACGVRPALFRAPHGFRAPWTSKVARSLGQRTVGWSAGLWDSDKPGSEEIEKRATKAAVPGAILLLHDGDGYDTRGDRSQTAQALKGIITAVQARGIEIVAL